MQQPMTLLVILLLGKTWLQASEYCHESLASQMRPGFWFSVLIDSNYEASLRLLQKQNNHKHIYNMTIVKCRVVKTAHSF